LNRYLDTSVLLPLYVPEPLTNQAVAIFEDSNNACISRLSEAEFYSALARKIRTSETARSVAQRVAELFERHLRTNAYTVVQVTDEAFGQCIDYLRGFGSPLRTLDALHLATCARAQLPLVTADKTLAKCALQYDVPCELVAEE
jgi:predicted nucleic acid-binding protein